MVSYDTTQIALYLSLVVAMAALGLTHFDPSHFDIADESVRTLAETGALNGERGAYRLARPLPAIQVPATVHCPGECKPSGKKRNARHGRTA